MTGNAELLALNAQKILDDITALTLDIESLVCRLDTIYERVYYLQEESEPGQVKHLPLF